MSQKRFCPNCGTDLIPNDRFCGGCGFDLTSVAVTSPPPPAPNPAPAPPYIQPPPPAAPMQPANYNSPPNMPTNQATMPGSPAGNLGATSNGGSKNALIIMVAILVVLFAGGGGLYWWLSKEEGPKTAGNQPAPTTERQRPGTVDNNVSVPVSQPEENEAIVPTDLSRASTYLSKPGLKASFDVDYPDGLMAITSRISGLAVSDEAVRISEVEIGVQQGEEYGFGFHYVERPDGIYYIMDSAPYEIFPVLKNNLTVGGTWVYESEYGNTVWTVVDMGVDLDLGFRKFNKCLLVMEDNQAVGMQTISYYAPGIGKVMAISPGGMEYYKMTSLEQIDPALAADTIKKWCPNYQNIRDDRTQAY